MPRGYPGSTPGVDPRSQGVIPRRFKRKKIFVTHELTNERTHGRTNRRDGRNSVLDFVGSSWKFHKWFYHNGHSINSTTLLTLHKNLELLPAGSP